MVESAPKQVTTLESGDPTVAPLPRPAADDPSKAGAPQGTPLEPGANPGAVARSIAALAGIGASIGLGLGQTGNTAVGKFVSENTASTIQRHALLLDLALGALAGLIVARLLLGGRSEVERARLSRVARLLAPLALVAVVPGLLGMKAWSDTLNLSIALGAFALGAEPLFRLHFGTYDDIPQLLGIRAATRRMTVRVPAVLRKHGPALCVGAAVATYIAFMGFLVLRSHAKFNTFNWDLGQLDNQFYNALHGHPFRCTVLIRGGDWSELRNHAEFSLFALLPFYALHPSAETLLLLQAILLGAAAIPLYRFAARRLPRWLSALLALAYLLYPPLHGAQLFDFHFQPVAAAFLLAAFDCFDVRRMGLFWLFFALAIGCREDISAGTAVLGMFLLMTGKRTRDAAIMTGVSVAWFVAMRFFVMPSVGSWGFADIYKDLFPAGESNFAGIMKTIVTNPVFTFRTLLTTDKLRYALQILAPLAFLPLRRPWIALSMIPGAFFTLLTTEYSPTLDIGFQYAGHFIPYIFPAAALALEWMGRDGDRLSASGIGGGIGSGSGSGSARLGRTWQRAAAATVFCATFVATFHWGAFPVREKVRSCYGWWKTFEAPTEIEQRRLSAVEEFAAMVPRDAILAASDREIPHVSNRLECWNLSAGYQGSDYILYSPIAPISGDLEQFNAAKRAGYSIVADRAEMVLLKRPGAAGPVGRER